MIQIILDAAASGKLNEVNQSRKWTAAELLQLPLAEQDAILEAAVTIAEAEYRSDPELTAFEAFGKDDLYVESSSTESR